MASNDWLQAVADRARVTSQEVSDVLAQMRIFAAPVSGSPRRLMLCEIEFSGVKTGIEHKGAFAFHWDKLDRGLYAMLTDGNFKGKSSVIEIVKWMFRGRPGDNLQEDVKSWIHHCRIRFEIDKCTYELQVNAADGTSGELVRFDRGGETTQLAEFRNDTAFEAVMADFFMNQFALGPVTRWQGGAEEEGGTAITHGWPALASAMFIGTNYASLLGDLPPNAGVSTPLMQMYLGLPWISTLTAAKAAQQGYRRENEARLRRRNAGRAERQRRINVLQAELDARREELSGTPSDEDIRTRLAQVSTELASVRASERVASERLEREEAAVSDLERVFAEDRRELQAHIDSEAAAEVFRMLDPSYCPRCDNAIAIERKKREKISHECSVCGEHITTDENATEIKERLERSVRETESALNRARRVRNDVDVALIDIREQVSSLEETADALSKRMANFGERRRLETEVVVLEARLAEASLDLEPADDKPDYTGILDALVAETELRVKAAQAQLLRTISEKIVSYAKRFGMDALNSAELKGNVTLPLVKGGRATTYSRVTQGEKLRLKVATVLAMISVAESKGVGRHPGLLMIDSPGAQEVTRKDLEELTAGLEEVAKEFDHLQVFIAAVASDAITAHVPRERVLYARGDAPLW